MPLAPLNVCHTSVYIPNVMSLLKDERLRKTRSKFGTVLQVRVPGHIRQAIRQELARMEKDGTYKTESDWIREAIVAKLKTSTQARS